MDYKEKYEKALANARKLYNEAKAIGYTSDMEDYETIFPELAESKDKKMKQELIKYFTGWQTDNLFRGYTAEEWIAWIEKQGAQKYIPKYKIGDYVKNTNYKGEPIYEIVYMDKECYICEYRGKEKMGDKAVMHFSFDNPYLRLVQKPADTVEPKFHKGDWAVSNLDGKARQISEVHFDKYNSYYVVNGKSVNLEEYDRLHHLWTIQDAKDGDILFQDLMGGKTFIYNGINPDMAILYSFIISNDGKDVLPYHIGKPNTGIGNIEENKNIIYPATKEQRDFLFQKMKETGYEWDADKLELKKIEDEPENFKQQVMSEMAGLVKDYIKQKPAEWIEDDTEYIKDSEDMGNLR
jgi:hypothetical protein